MSHYWLHRISYEADVSYPLLDKGYLSLGWSVFSRSQILEAARKNDQNVSFENEYCKIEKGEKARQRWSMWYFARFNKNDIVVVPLEDGKFTICRVIEEAKPIQTIKDVVLRMMNRENKSLQWNDETNLLKVGEHDIDLGFVVKVEEVNGERALRRDYADDKLTSRMKIQQANGCIDDIAYSVEKAIEGIGKKQPINFYATALETASDALMEAFTALNADKFELLVKQYMEKIGADYAYIPAKNEHGKEDEADADVIAQFNVLKLNILIQVKFHEDKTDEYAVKQIYKYNEQLMSESSELTIENDYQNIMWVISRCEYTEEAKRLAAENEVRLITGKEFCKMLVDAGLSSINPK